MQRKYFLFLYMSTLFLMNGFSQSFTLTISGKNQTETKILDSIGYSKKHEDFLSIKTETETLQKTLFKIGYIENEIRASEKLNDSVFLYKLSLKNKFKRLHVYYNKNNFDITSVEHISKKTYNNYFILNLNDVENALAYINSETSKKGFPFSKLKLSEITIKNDSTLKASLKITSQEKQRAINEIIIKGYEKFPKSYLKHFLKIKPKQVFDLNTIKNKTQQLNNLTFSNEIKSPEVLFSKDSTTLYLYLEKAQSNTFDGFLGFGTNEDTNRIQFDGYLNLNLINNLNFGEQFRLLYKSDENDQQTFETDISLPYLFNTPIGADLLLRIFKKDSSFTTVNQSAKIHYQINYKHKIYAGITATESNNLLNTSANTFITDFKTQHYTLAYEYLKPQINNKLFPITSKLFLEAAFGNRKTKLKTEKQSQFTFDAQKIVPLNNKNSLFFRGHSAGLITDTYFENELLRFGGINSIRGFEENSLFASLFGVLNTEYRYQVNNTIYIHSILDAGYFENKVLNSKEKLFGYGFGFGILTKAGLLRFNYANGKNENIRFKLANSKIHISLTTIF